MVGRHSVIQLSRTRKAAFLAVNGDKNLARSSLGARLGVAALVKEQFIIPSFEAYSRKWKRTSDSVLKGLDTLNFSKWLFRQGN